MQCMITSGYIKNVESTKGQEGKTWFIPYHGVTTKINLVKLELLITSPNLRVCLNDCLYQGPDLNNNLLGVFFWF